MHPPSKPSLCGMDIGKMRTADPRPIFASVLFVVKKPISAVEGAAISSVPTADRRWTVTAMTELLWWVEPLFETGLILFLFAGVIAFVTLKSSSDVWLWIIVILLLPLFISIAATIIWGVSRAFWFIWEPYF